MLTGPQSFDPASFRTGFTPDLSNFKTGLTPLGSANGYPLPSPGTSAFLAMVNQGGSTITPNTFNAITNSFGGAGTAGNAGAANGADGKGNSSSSVGDGDFDLAFGKNLSSGRHAPQESGIRSSAAGESADKDADKDVNVSPQMIQRGGQQQPDAVAGGKQANGQPTSTQAASGLFLLSQAHQELSKRDEAAASHIPHGSGLPPGAMPPGMMAHPANASAHYGGGGPIASTSATGNGKPASNKRKKSAGGGQSDSVDSAPASGKGSKASKKAKPPKKESSAAPSTGFDDDQDELSGSENGANGGMGGGAGSGNGSVGDDDEEKRRNFLERNRQAALKCRQRKKAWLQDLQAKVAFFESENGNLQGTIGALRSEVMFLKSQLMHAQQHMAAKGIGMPGPMQHEGPPGGGQAPAGGMLPPGFVPPGGMHPHHHQQQQHQHQQSSSPQQQQGPLPGQGPYVGGPGGPPPNERAFSPTAGPKAQAA